MTVDVLHPIDLGAVPRLWAIQNLMTEQPIS